MMRPSSLLVFTVLLVGTACAACAQANIPSPASIPPVSLPDHSDLKTCPSCVQPPQLQVPRSALIYTQATQACRQSGWTEQQVLAARLDVLRHVLAAALSSGDLDKFLVAESAKYGPFDSRDKLAYRQDRVDFVVKSLAGNGK